MKPALLFLSIVLFPFFVIAQDTIPPTPVLMDYGSVQLQGDSMSFPASFFNIGSYDNQTDSSDLKFAYSEDVSDSIKTIYCHNKYNIEFDVFVFDTSGNYASKEIENRFESQNCPDTVDALLPTPYCLNGVATFVDEHGVTIPAHYFNAGSRDDQTPEDQLRYSYSEDINDTLRHFDCEDIGTTIEVSIYVHDLSGKSDYCTTYLRVTDGEDCEANTTVVDVIDTISPRLLVYNGIGRVVIPMNNIFGIRAENFVIDAFDNVTESENLHFSFSTDPTDTMTYYSCAHEGTNIFDIYCFDEAGNWSRAGTYIYLQTHSGQECEYPDVDTIPPSITCNSDTLEIFIEEEDSTAYVGYQDLIDTAYDDHTLSEELFLSIGSELLNSSLSFSCDDLGYHTVELYASDLVFNTGTCEATIEVNDNSGICQTTSVKPGITAHEMEIYPNPATDRIHFLAPKGGEIHIIDALGRQVYAEKIRANVPVQLNVQFWNIGVYSAVLINQKGERKSTLFIVQ